MSEGPKCTRRWLQFSLRTLLLAVTALGVWLGWNMRQMHERESLLDGLASRNAIVCAFTPGSAGHGNFPQRQSSAPRTIPLTWSLLGANQIDEIFLEDGRFTLNDVDRFKALFPGARIHRCHRVSPSEIRFFDSPL